MYPTEANTLPYSSSPELNSAFNAISTRAHVQALQWLKRGIWLYFLLLIFEGALRKWVLPALATPLLVVRDPVAIGLLGYAYMHGFLKKSFYVTCIWLITAISLITTLLLGHGNLFVALYGARILLFHFPLIFLFGSVLTKQDVVQFGKALLWITLPMTVLMAVQFYSPQTAWVNWTVGGEVQKIGFTGALGYFRPPGTFSFTNGLSAYYGLVAAFVFYFWVDLPKSVPKWLLILASACLFAAIPLSISRTLFFSVLLSGAFVFAISFVKPQMIGSIVLACIGCIILFYLLSTLGFFKTGIEVFTTRFDDASAVEGGVQSTLADRFLGGLLAALSSSELFPFWGLGIGMGTNAGSQLLSGKVQYLIAEGEWGRMIGEMGVLLGFAIIILRMHFTLTLGVKSFSALKKNNLLPWLLLSFSALNILQGQWAQPTALGFSIVSGGLTLAALQSSK